MNSDPRFKNVSKILLADWDPIGISDTVVVHDEYDGYAAEIAGMLARNAASAELAAYLVRIESQDLGLEAQPERARAVAGKLRLIL